MYKILIPFRRCSVQVYEVNSPVFGQKPIKFRAWRLGSLEYAETKQREFQWYYRDKVAVRKEEHLYNTYNSIS